MAPSTLDDWMAHQVLMKEAKAAEATRQIEHRRKEKAGQDALKAYESIYGQVPREPFDGRLKDCKGRGTVLGKNESFRLGCLLGPATASTPVLPEHTSLRSEMHIKLLYTASLPPQH